MKRGNYEGGPSPGAAPAAVKRHRGDGKFEVRLLVPSKCAGSIIGKGGQNIQKLRTEFNANIRVPDCPGPERVMTVQADSPDVTASVLEQTVTVLTEESMRGGGNNAAPNNKSSSNEADGPVLEARLLIHQSIVGGIIGRAGFKIKEIRDASGANIKVYQTCAPQSTDRCVAVQGSLSKMIRAMKEVFDVISNTEIKGVDQPYDPINFDGYYAAEYGGYGTEMDVYGGPPRMGNFGNPMGGGGGGGGRGGGGGMRGGSRGGNMSGGGFPFQRGGMARNDGGFGRGGFNEGFNNRGAGGFGRGGGNGNRGYEVGYNNVDVMARNAGSNNYNNGGGPPQQDQAPPAGNFGNSGAEDSGEQETTQVTIPKDMAGAIIGPGGSRIRKIRSDSKASITIDEPVQGSNERIITISGTQRQIQTAQFLLQQSVREHAGPPQMGYGGPQPRY